MEHYNFPAMWVTKIQLSEGNGVDQYWGAIVYEGRKYWRLNCEVNQRIMDVKKAKQKDNENNTGW